MCGCNSCQGCSSSEPRMNGKEITILSGLRENNSEQSQITNSDSDTSNVGRYAVVGSAIILAVIAGFASKK
jgi:hypothetical protein